MGHDSGHRAPDCYDRQYHNIHPDPVPKSDNRQEIPTCLMCLQKILEKHIPVIVFCH